MVNLRMLFYTSQYFSLITVYARYHFNLSNVIKNDDTRTLVRSSVLSPIRPTLVLLASASSREMNSHSVFGVSYDNYLLHLYLPMTTRSSTLSYCLNAKYRKVLETTTGRLESYFSCSPYIRKSAACRKTRECRRFRVNSSGKLQKKRRQGSSRALPRSISVMCTSDTVS